MLIWLNFYIYLSSELERGVQDELAKWISDKDIDLTDINRQLHIAGALNLTLLEVQQFQNLRKRKLAGEDLTPPSDQVGQFKQYEEALQKAKREKFEALREKRKSGASGDGAVAPTKLELHVWNKMLVTFVVGSSSDREEIENAGIDANRNADAMELSEPERERLRVRQEK